MVQELSILQRSMQFYLTDTTRVHYERHILRCDQERDAARKHVAKQQNARKQVTKIKTENIQPRRIDQEVCSSVHYIVNMFCVEFKICFKSTDVCDRRRFFAKCSKPQPAFGRTKTFLKSAQCVIKAA